MGFGKAFLISLIAFVGINFIFTIIYYAFIGFAQLINDIQSDPIMILYYLFGSIISTPSTILNWTIAEPFLSQNMDMLILGLGHLVAPLIAAILAGRFGESKSQSFGGWLLAAVISTASVIIAAWLNPATANKLNTIYVWPLNDVLVLAIISCLVNIVFYGFFALLLSKEEYY
ncbi:MAG: hypothetical protein R3255_02855 [Candidatus Lokiarchaeia archaeon]|nr:hypothetical protein [Candidatus Lokiarchaeia archaeon]